MNYAFPMIRTIQDVLPHIEGRPEFVVAKRAPHDWTFINYNVAFEDTFPPVETVGDAIRRECRGIVFDAKGNILSRRLHKFFNVNEREETQAHAIDLSRPHVILEKLDGSMITPLFDSRIPDNVYWGTKMGLTDVATSTEFVTFIRNHPTYNTFALQMRRDQLTPIFEWCSRAQRIVVDHPVDRLVLIAIRDNRTGYYVSYNDMVWLAQQYGVEVVQQYPGTAQSMENLVANVRDQEEGEGWVIRFDDGHMIKVKADWYVRVHKTKDLIQFERNVVSLIVNGEIDDVIPILDAGSADRLVRYRDQFRRVIFDLATDIAQAAKTTYAAYDRKIYATQYRQCYEKEFGPRFSHFVFAFWDRQNDVELATAHQYLIQQAGSNTLTNAKWEQFKQDWRLSNKLFW